MTPRTTAGESAVGYLAELFEGIQGEGLFAGYHHAFIRLAGCSLGCKYCDTRYAQKQDGPFRVLRGAGTVIKELESPTSVATTVKELGSLINSSSSISAVCVTGGEPLEQPVFLGELLKAIEPFEVPILLETNGVEHESLDRLLNLLGIISIDIKLPSTSGRNDLWDRHEAFLQAARHKQVFIKVAIDDTTEPREVQRAAKMVAGTLDEAPFFLQPVTDSTGALTISYRHILELFDVCARQLRDVRVMPQIHKMIGSL